jgi:hypothetical protein
LRLRKILKQRKEAWGGSAAMISGSRLTVRGTPCDVRRNVSPRIRGLPRKLRVKARQFGELCVVPVAFGFLLSQPDQSLKVPGVTLLEQLVAEHRAECRGERHRQLESDVLLDEASH